MPQPEFEACESCQYFILIDQRLEVGECRYDSPKINPTHMLAQTNDGYWPTTYTHKWCGRYKLVDPC